MSEVVAGAHVNEVEQATQRIGRDLFERVQKDAGAFFRAERWTGQLLEWSMRHSDTRLQLFRFVDVLPTLDDPEDVVRHLKEYFEGKPDPFGGLMRVGLGVAGMGRLGARAASGTLRRGVEQMARSFIAGETAAEVGKVVAGFHREGLAFTVDVLGEATLSEAEAADYERRYTELLQTLTKAAERWPRVEQVDESPAGTLPRVNVSVKLSALYSQLDPINPEASTAAVMERLRPLLTLAKERGAHIQIDMEDYRLKDLTFHIFREIIMDPAFVDYRHFGIVLQAYLRDAEADATRLIQWARERGTPFNVRLVKGAYWDYETVHSRLQGWSIPVFERKWESDASFERVTRMLLENSAVIDTAIASHNIRSIAHALALSKQLGLPPRTVEYQVLYGMATPLRRALLDLGERVRVYTPYGELIPGMAYLVRRLLENTSQQSFLRQGFAEGESPEQLLRNPVDVGAEEERAAGNGVVTGSPGDANGTTDTGAINTEAGGAGAIAASGTASGAASVSGADDDEGRDALDTSPATVARISPMPPHVQEQLAANPLEYGGWGAGPEFGLPPYRNEPLYDFAQAEARRRMSEAIERVRGELGRYHPLLIGDETISTEGEIVSTNPSMPSEVIGRTARALPEHVDKAVAVANSAFHSWRNKSARERVDILRRAAQMMRERRFELAALVMLENGKPWREADGDVTEALDFIEWYSRAALRLGRPQRMAGLFGEINHYIYEPRGVAGVIAPWNFPLAILTGMSVAALAAGNSVVLKPAEQTPVIAAKLVEIYREAGVPAGVINYLPGMGEDAGAALVSHPDVHVIAFTGSQEVGLNIIKQAAVVQPGQHHIKQVITELGGKNAVIVDDDADLDEAVAGIIESAFGFTGQKCSAASRVIVLDRMYDAFLERITEATRSLIIGPSWEPETFVGPVIEDAARQRILNYIEDGRKSGRELLVHEPSQRVRDLGGHYVPLAVYADVEPDAKLAREEIFGPVLAVMRAKTFDDALDIANGIEYKLTGGIFSRSPARIERARKEFLVGNFYINRSITGSLVGRQPFGGLGLSGTGFSAGGPDYVKQFVGTRVITENTLRRGFADDIAEFVD